MDKLTSGPGGVILPLLLGAGAVMSPRIASGVSTALGAVDWARRSRKESEDEKAFSDLAGILGNQGTPTPPPAAPAGAGAAEGQPTPTEQPPPTATAQPANPLTMGVPQNVLSNPAVARIMLPIILNQYEKMNTPREHFGVAGDQPGVYSSKGVGQKYEFNPVGPKNPPNFAPAQDAVAMQLFGKPANQLNQQEWGSASDYLEQQKIKTEGRAVENYFTKQDWMNQQTEKRQFGMMTEAQLKADTASARRDYTNLNNTYRLNTNSLNKELDTRTKALPLGGDKKKQAEAELGTWKTDQEKALMDDYLAQFEDWKTSYGHISDRLKDFGMGGTPKVIEIRRNKLGGGGGGFSQPTQEDLSGYQNAIKSNQGNPAVLDAINKKAMKAWGRLP